MELKNMSALEKYKFAVDIIESLKWDRENRLTYNNYAERNENDEKEVFQDELDSLEIIFFSDGKYYLE